MAGMRVSFIGKTGQEFSKEKLNQGDYILPAIIPGAKYSQERSI